MADFITHIDAVFGDGPMADALDAPYIQAVRAEFEVSAHRKALATFVMAASTLYWQIIDEVGSHLLAAVKAEVAGDFIVASEAGLAACLNERYSPWGVRRPDWPENCIVAVESQRPFFDEIKFGVKAPDKNRLSKDEQSLGSVARPRLESLATQVPGGRKSIHWPWEQPVWERSWSQEFAARLVIHSPTGRVSDHPEIQELARKFVDVAHLVDKSIQS
ncbi:hypothetical protein [Devosia sp. Leaf420]|uniref:hypothetical protein n=1 Tax=Devosia sp. Leaf420 TaxID=1736374 RepID=UPI0012E7CE7E|nr:hypothetical protein [Devosia sp. Leaf420]